jgi:hypothetical protein
MNEAAKLYIDLLIRALTDTMFAPEPDWEQDSELRFLVDFKRHYIDGRAITMLPRRRLDQLVEAASMAVAENVPGDMIETGVWRGGAAILMRGVLAALEVRDRIVWVADSFEGLPKPDNRFPLEAKAFDGPVLASYDRMAAGLDAVKANFHAFGLLDGQVRFLKGWFRDTLPIAPIERIAVLRVDGDFYESTMDALTHLYPRVSIGGTVIIDDYGEDGWTYCRQAVDEFRAAQGIREPLVSVDRACAYWRRSH